jgi:hypothetical protein
LWHCGIAGGFVLGHTNFVKLFRMFCNSHFNYGFTLFLNLLIYLQFIVDSSQYMAVSWATWLFALDLLYAPFIFNCLALDRGKKERMRRKNTIASVSERKTPWK